MEWRNLRIIIDGTVGVGKTTVLVGSSQRDKLKRKFTSIKDFGFPVFSDLVIDVIREMRAQGIQDPSQNWNYFFNLATQHAIAYYKSADVHTVNFYDRGIFFLEIMAKRYGCDMPQNYYDFCQHNRYDAPVFIFCPIWGIDMTKPHEMDNRGKIYTDSERKLQQQQIIDLYKKYGYEIVEVPLGSNNIYESVDYRLKKIKEVLGL